LAPPFAIEVDLVDFSESSKITDAGPGLDHPWYPGLNPEPLMARLS